MIERQITGTASPQTSAATILPFVLCAVFILFPVASSDRWGEAAQALFPRITPTSQVEIAIVPFYGAGMLVSAILGASILGCTLQSVASEHI